METNCIFCRIAAGEIPARKVLDTEHVVAFHDVNSQAPIHILVIPRVHVAGFQELPGADTTWNVLLEAAQQIVLAQGLTTGFRLVVNQGDDGGQTVQHLHLHILGGRRLGWPPG